MNIEVNITKGNMSPSFIYEHQLLSFCLSVTFLTLKYSTLCMAVRPSDVYTTALHMYGCAYSE